MDAYYAETKEEAVKKALEWIPEGSTINMGGASSVHECGLIDAIKSGNYNFCDRDKAATQEEKQEIARAAFSCDWFLGSVNAMSEDGVFINIDGNANRVAAYAFGPKNVLLIVGMNKVVKTQEDAMSRARNEAAPVNAQRFGIDTPCSKAGSCFDCKSPECICCQILTNFVDKLRNDWVGVDYASTEWMQKWNEDSTLPQEKIEQYSKWLEDRIIEDAQEEYDRREQDNEQNLEEHTTISGGGETGR